MKQNQNNIECAPTKQEEGVANCLIQMCKDSNAAITSFSMSCEDGYEVTISARKKGKRTYNEFSLEEFETIKAMAKEKLDQAEDKQKLQDIIDVCDSNIEDIRKRSRRKKTDQSHNINNIANETKISKKDII